jgi:Protein of unknown function (DUF3096)
MLELVAQRADIVFNTDLTGFLALAAGVLILIVPRLLNYIVAGYLIIVGLIILFNLNI